MLAGLAEQKREIADRGREPDLLRLDRANFGLRRLRLHVLAGLVLQPDLAKHRERSKHDHDDGAGTHGCS